MKNWLAFFTKHLVVHIAVLASLSTASTASLADELTGIGSIAAGSYHNCVLSTAGGVKCWGANNVGQLGNNSTTSSSAQDVVGLSSGVTAIATGGSHSCALTSAGGVKCWGQNGYGQLGNGTTTFISKVPVDVTGLSSGVKSIVAGNYYSCALTIAGAVKCWGYNYTGQLGNPSVTATTSTLAVDVTALASGVVAISASGYHTCALDTVGVAKCWGYNGFGQLGNNSDTSSATPVAVAELGSGVTSIGAGAYHTCAITAAGAAKCWGYNAYGQLGDNSTLSRWTPSDVSGLTSGVRAIVAATYHTCALNTTGEVKCWGWNSYGQLGNNSPGDSMTPVAVAGLAGASAIALGTLHGCAVTATGGVACWGENGSGQLGSTPNRAVPGDVAGLTSGVSAVSAGDTHTCALTVAGGLKCWGGSEMLGNISLTNTSTAVDVGGLTSGIQAVAAGSGHTCASTTAGGVKCWGFNDAGQLGDNSFTEYSSPTPIDVKGLASAVIGIAVGASHSCALVTGGAIKCWGNNNDGQLGNQTVINSSVPMDVAGLLAVGLAMGQNHTCALTVAGGVKCWGNNDEGQLGNASLVFSSTPVDVTGLASGVLAIAANGHNTCALTNKGGVKCWGSNGNGQLGNAIYNGSSTPLDVSALTSGVAAIALGNQRACALTSNGGVKCWGYNNYGQLGNNSTTKSTKPVDVSGLAAGVTAIAVNGDHACALTSEGGIKCWGYNYYGQLGDGANLGWTPAPVLVTVTPVCGLSASAATITSGTPVDFTAACSPLPTSYAWSGGVLPGGAAAGTLLPFFTTTYTVQGGDASGPGNIASAAVVVTDTMTVLAERASYTLLASGGDFILTDANGVAKTLTGIKRLKFNDISVALDIGGVGGKAYRLYQAAFNRAPDLGGLGYQMAAMEISGLSYRQVAQNFINSPEFAATYGATTDVQFVTLLYANVLKRAPEADGLAFYLDGLAKQTFTRAGILAGFADSAENQGLVLPAIVNGMQYISEGGN